MAAQDTSVAAAAISSASTVMAAQNTPVAAAAISSASTKRAAMDTLAAASHELRKQRATQDTPIATAITSAST